MKILHTSDWHLGKNLEGFSRLEEQKEFLKDLINICDENEIDILIIAGDIYDTYNPSANAENLFYNYIKKLSNNGERLIIINAGNHDNAYRLVASKPFAKEHGVIICGSPNEFIETGRYGKYHIENVDSGVFSIFLNEQKINFINIAYPSEKVLNELISKSFDENELQNTYSKKIGNILFDRLKKISEEDINVVIGHLYISGGQSSDSERQIQLGGTLAVNLDDIPNVDYIALGHLHKPQEFTNKNLYYSGSPIQYSKSEINYKKSVFIIEFKTKLEKFIEKIELKNYKPIEIWKSDSIEKAIEICNEYSEKNCYVYLEIKTDRVIKKSELKEIKSLKSDIVSITPILDNNIIEENDENIELDVNQKELFIEYFTEKKGVSPTDEVIDKFLELAIGE